ncbi:hypothetical protein J1614_000178 [Plenodomus biglobosus]|nr:hypothetical protein J1614_000178 [Plenodomus biglobosus]
MASVNVDYDTDTISITSTVSSTKETNYDAVQVLSERPSTEDDCTTMYLIEWENYPMHSRNPSCRCKNDLCSPLWWPPPSGQTTQMLPHSTWEPEYHLDGTNLLELWELEKQRLGEAASEKLMHDNESRYCAAVKQAREAHERRQDLRRKKRSQLRKRARHVVTDSESESEAEEHLKVQQQPRKQQDVISQNVPQATEAETSRQLDSLFIDSQVPQASGPDTRLGTPDSGLFINQAPSARRPPLQQSDSSSPSEDEDEDEDAHAQTSDDSLLDELRSTKQIDKPEKKSERRTTTLGKSTLETQHPPVNGVQLAKGQVSKNVPASQISTITSSERSKKHSSDSLRRTVQPPVASKSSTTNSNPPKPQPTLNSLKSMKRTEPPKTASGIKIVNQPLTQRSPWQNSDKAFSTLKFRRNAEKRARAEGAPELGALSFVGGLPPGMTRSKTLTSGDDVYGRREAGIRRLQELDEDDVQRRTPMDHVEPLNDWEADKVPLVCAQWRLSNNCEFGARRCFFMHRNQDASGRDLPVGDPGGYIPPKYHKPPITCRYWLLDPNGCLKPGSVCPYAHKNTGHILSEQRNTSEIIDPTMKPVSEQRAAGKMLTCPYWLYEPRGCIKTDDECIFAHTNTGLVANRNGSDPGPKQVIDMALKPVSEHNMGLSQQEVSKPSIPSSKITCYFWTNNRCRLTSETCKYQHRYTGTIALPPPGSQTCRLWYEGDRCPKNSAECAYRHKFTGYVSSPQLDRSGPATTESRSRLERDSLPRYAHSASDEAADGIVMHDTDQGDKEAPSHQPAPTTVRHFDVFNQQSPRQPPPPPPPIAQEITQADTVCLTLKANIEQICKLDFLNIFTRNDGSALLDRTAFLLYHPEQHSEELELITRWLLMHHVEVSNAWYDGSWDGFRQHILKRGSGVVVTHPEFEYFTELPGFGQLLRKEVRIWCVGTQNSIEYFPSPEGSAAIMRHDCIELFPHGGFIYITDEVFEQKPQLALKIVQQFSEKIARLRLLAGPISPWQAVDDACLLWRLCTRPELAEYLFQRCEEQATELDAGDPSVTSRAELYTILAEHKLVDHSSEPLSLISDKFPIISERQVIAEDPRIDYFNTLARSQQEANMCMIRYYSLVQADMARDYRHFFVVHTEPKAAYVQDWMQDIQSIAAVITPEKCLEELQKDGSVSMFDFCERHMPKL